MEAETYKLDPQTGKIVTRYVSPEPLGFGLACGDGEQLAVFTIANDRLHLLTLAPKH